MRLLLALAFIAWTSTCARALVYVLLPPRLRDAWTIRLSALAAGWGAITLVPAWIMIGSGRHAFPAALASTFVLALAGRLMRRGRDDHPRMPDAPSMPLEWLLLAAVGAVGISILVNAAAWPFDIGDALALYAPFGRHLYERSALPAGDGIYEAYPMLVPMAFALTHWVSGGVNEYVARLVPALLGLGAIGAAGLLGAAIADRRAGLLAAALAACTPVFGRWASTGYTDVPAAFFTTLAIVFTWHWWRSADRSPLALASVCIGLALWTKNSTVPLLLSVAWLVAWRAFGGSRHAPRAARTVLADAVAAFGPALAVAGPWYAHTWLTFGVLVPSTMLVDRADRSPAALGIMLRPDQHFGLAGIVFTAAVAYAGWMLLREHGPRRDRWHVLLAFVAPFGSAWWWLASYEARFLMVLVPAFAAMGGAMLIDLAEHLERLAPTGRIRRALLLLAGALVVTGTAASVRKSIEHKPLLLRDPFMSDADRHRVRLGGLYDLARALNSLEPGSRVGGVPRILAYHLDSRRVPMMAWAPLPSVPELAETDYDYVVASPGGPDIQTAPGEGTPAPLLATADGYRLYRFTAPRPARAR